ncbi:formyl transferase [Alterisphingorhabdus coralli]|uniref:phosphoribosylglycinamide formyltransferase 1 n=1 Tax=Alterisphingorhabdus coralli TaxID=3071408 RepID=A0AA97F8E8_9SPHN|nr:formyl transferase [Parasphingorhabdus sp. SCSIO 66989]WOE74410.1 formyl transferase [Parasphingorhabdus sp. SCSIO 66989]
MAEAMRIFLLSHDRAKRGSTVAMALQRHGVTPTGFVFEAYRPPKLRRRIARRLAEQGIPVLAPKTQAKADGQDNAAPDPYADILPAAEYAGQEGISATQVADLTSPESLEALRALEPDLFIHAGAGILRAPLLAIPKLGTMNAHMGLLPRYRGMNVAEWSVLEGQQVGCTVHLLDPGIDTGDIIATRNVDVADCDSITALRAKMDRAQLDFLGQTVKTITETGELPPHHPQQEADGRQYFAMHADLKRVLEKRLAK